jgi:cell wall-associated NlpC family hydrolase
VTPGKKIGTIAGTMAVLLTTGLTALPGMASARSASFNLNVANYAASFIGRVPYRYGGTSPSTGFDCSGMTQYVYRHYGRSIPRTADAQFRHFRSESRGAARGGDLVFFHVNSSPSSYVYHVGVYEGSNHMVSAADPAEGIVWQSIWTRAVTFGTITH